jgi:hypothetical protein
MLKWVQIKNLVVGDFIRLMKMEKEFRQNTISPPEKEGFIPEKAKEVGGYLWGNFLIEERLKLVFIIENCQVLDKDIMGLL